MVAIIVKLFLYKKRKIIIQPYPIAPIKSKINTTPIENNHIKMTNFKPKIIQPEFNNIPFF